LEVLLGYRRQDAALEANHRADERVHDHEQGELREVRAEPEAHFSARRGGLIRRGRYLRHATRP
jgi:hypothetical protein